MYFIMPREKLDGPLLYEISNQSKQKKCCHKCLLVLSHTLVFCIGYYISLKVNSCDGSTSG